MASVAFKYTIPKLSRLHLLQTDTSTLVDPTDISPC